MKLIYQALAAVFFLAVSHYTLAAPAVTGAHVLYVGTYGSGDFFVGLDKTINEPGCVSARFDVAGGHSQVANWLEVAKEARVTGRTVTIKTNGCFNNSPTMDNSRNTYFHIN